MVPPRTPTFRGRVRSAAVQQPGPSSHPTLRWRKADPNLPCNRHPFCVCLKRAALGIFATEQASSGRYTEAVICLGAAG
jgi:hypothetical protein